MKKKLMGLIICLIGFGMGFLSLLYSNEAVQSLEECTRKVVNPSIKDKKDWIFSSKFLFSLLIFQIKRSIYIVSNK